MNRLQSAAVVAALFMSGGAASSASAVMPVPAGPATRVAIGDVGKTQVGQEIEVVGYFSHKSDEIDGDLQVWLIDHKGAFVVVEAPRRFRDMKYFIRGLHFHRGELVIATGVLTRQHDKPTINYPNGWMEIQPVDSIARYEGSKPADLHYVRVAHHLFGHVTVTQE
jgi:hypothetical protein